MHIACYVTRYCIGALEISNLDFQYQLTALVYRSLCIVHCPVRYAFLKTGAVSRLQIRILEET
jgi:hypothetical protein